MKGSIAKSVEIYTSQQAERKKQRYLHTVIVLYKPNVVPAGVDVGVMVTTLGVLATTVVDCCSVTVCVVIATVTDDVATLVDTMVDSMATVGVTVARVTKESQISLLSWRFMDVSIRSSNSESCSSYMHQYTHTKCYNMIILLLTTT